MKLTNVPKVFVILLCLIACMTWRSTLLFASEKTTVGLSVLNQHRFLTNSDTRLPFIQTYYRNNLTYGQALDMRLPILKIGDQVVWGLRGDLVFIGLEFEYQQAINSWIAPFVSFSMFGRLGTGIQSILAQGLSYASEFEMGALIKLRKTKRTQLAATLNLWNSSGAIVNFYDFVNGVLKNGLTPDNKLVLNRPFMRGGGGLRYSWAATRMIGVTLTGECGYGQSIDKRIQNKAFYNFMGTVDLDFAQSKYGIPVGFILGSSLDTFRRAGDNTLNGNLVGTYLSVAFTGRADYVLSFDMIWQRLPIKMLDQTLNSSIFRINSQYSF